MLPNRAMRTVQLQDKNIYKLTSETALCRNHYKMAHPH